MNGKGIEFGDLIANQLHPVSVFLLLFSALLFWAPSARAQEGPYIITYDHYLEEPGSLEVEYFSTYGTQRGGNDYHAYWAELEYGVKAWWTTEFYVDGQTTFSQSTVFTGFRWENRIRPNRGEGRLGARSLTAGARSDPLAGFPPEARSATTCIRGVGPRCRIWTVFTSGSSRTTTCHTSRSISGSCSEPSSVQTRVSLG